MKNKWTLLPAFAMLLMAFTNDTPAKTGQRIFGDCGCNGTDKNAGLIQLTISDDFTFHYINRSDPAETIDTKGSWAQQKGDILLKNYDSGVKIHSKWKLDKDYPCIRSRKEMFFLRLCEVKPCE